MANVEINLLGLDINTQSQLLRIFQNIMGIPFIQYKLTFLGGDLYFKFGEQTSPAGDAIAAETSELVTTVFNSDNLVLDYVNNTAYNTLALYGPDGALIRSFVVPLGDTIVHEINHHFMPWFGSSAAENIIHGYLRENLANIAASSDGSKPSKHEIDQYFADEFVFRSMTIAEDIAAFGKPDALETAHLQQAVKYLSENLDTKNFDWAILSPNEVYEKMVMHDATLGSYLSEQMFSADYSFMNIMINGPFQSNVTYDYLNQKLSVVQEEEMYKRVFSYENEYTPNKSSVIKSGAEWSALTLGDISKLHPEVPTDLNVKLVYDELSLSWKANMPFHSLLDGQELPVFYSIEDAGSDENMRFSVDDGILNLHKTSVADSEYSIKIETKFIDGQTNYTNFSVSKDLDTKIPPNLALYGPTDIGSTLFAQIQFQDRLGQPIDIDATKLGHFTWHVNVDGIDSIIGSDSPNLKISDKELNGNIYYTYLYNDNSGEANQYTSDYTGPVLSPAGTGLVYASGSFNVGDTLEAHIFFDNPDNIDLSSVQVAWHIQSDYAPHDYFSLNTYGKNHEVIQDDYMNSTAWIFPELFFTNKEGRFGHIFGLNTFHGVSSLGGIEQTELSFAADANGGYTGNLLPGYNSLSDLHPLLINPDKAISINIDQNFNFKVTLEDGAFPENHNFYFAVSDGSSFSRPIHVELLT